MGILRFSLIAILLVLLIRRKLDLGLSLLIAAAALGLMYAMGIGELAAAAAVATFTLEAVEIIVAVLMIVFLSELMKRKGQIKKMVDALRKLLGDPKGVVALVPAIIGFLPIIGGAMISAPMVEEASDELKLSPEKKTFLNYWFRHLWEYIFPTYPGVILSSAILGVGLSTIAAANLPLTFAAVAAGLFFGFRGVSAAGDGRRRISGRILIDFFVSGLPLVVVILAVLVFKTDLALTLVLVFLVSMLIYRATPREVGTIVRENFSFAYVSIVAGILAFKGVLEATGAAAEIAANLSSLGIPPFFVLIILPFVIAMSTGMTMAFVGITFPILLTYFTTGDFPLIAFMLAYAGGYAGIMLSPVHLCLVLTARYYRAELSSVYRLLVAPVVFVLAVAALAYLVINYLV
jgi:integral membrane protein (TIGR00529 family)